MDSFRERPWSPEINQFTVDYIRKNIIKCSGLCSTHLVVEKTRYF